MKEGTHKNLQINEFLNQIFSICNKRFIKSIILIGSAARDELTAQINENDSFVSDIEICVLIKPFFILKCKRKRITLKIKFYKIEILFTYVFFLKFLKTPLVYDLKTTGKILWGKDIRKSIWINDPKQIPYWEGVRFLYNRLIPFELLLWKYTKNLTISKNEEYDNIKLLIAIGEYIMIKDRNFVSSYREKLKYFKKKNEKNKKIQLILTALKYKLNIAANFDNLKSIKSTSKLVYDILKNINCKLNFFRVPISVRLFDMLNKIQNRDFLKLFSDLKIIPIYKKAFQLLEYFIKFPQLFLKCSAEIELILNNWENCVQIQSSYI